MVERVCPRCDAGNPSDNAFCGQCGAALQPHESVQPLARKQSAAIARRSIHIPAQWKQTGKVVALGMATIAAEVGMAWLNRRHQPLAPRPALRAQTARVIGVGRRIVETWHNGELQYRSDEQIMWLQPD